MSFHFLIFFFPSEAFLDIELLKEHAKKKKKPNQQAYAIITTVRLHFCITNSGEISLEFTAVFLEEHC